jgi:hypothetical protein
MNNWKEMLLDAMWERGETLADIEANTMTDEEMNKEFDSGYGGTEGVSFTVWTKNTVYFPICYDGAEWVGSVSRNPDGKSTEHQGGC